VFIFLKESNPPTPHTAKNKNDDWQSVNVEFRQHEYLKQIKPQRREQREK
jgi:hypothetical protein